MAALSPLADARFREARGEGRREPEQAYRFDALVRGHVATEEELCELVGFGPVPVSSVREIIVRDRPFLAAVLTKAKAVVGVAHLGRRLSAHQLTALQWSMPTCSVAGCGQTARLEYDHRKDWAKTHETSLEGTDPLCHHHHVLKTRDGWALVEGTGTRAFVAPWDPRHPRHQRGQRRPEGP